MLEPISHPARVLRGFLGDRDAARPPSAVSPAPPPQPDPAKRAAYEELHRLETRVAAHRLSWVDAGRALAEIQRRALYRDRSASFEQYLRERWGLSRRHGLDLVTAAAVADNVHDVRHTLSMRAALKLAKLPAAEQAQCLTQAIHGSGSRSPTADYLAAAVASRLPASRKRRGRKAQRPKTIRLRVSAGTITILAKHAGADLRALLEEGLRQLTTVTPAAA